MPLRTQLHSLSHLISCLSRKPFVLFAFQFYPGVFFPFPIFFFLQWRKLCSGECKMQYKCVLIFTSEREKMEVQKETELEVFLFFFFIYMKYSEKRPHRRGSVALSPLPWLPSLHISGARKPVNIYLPIRVPSSASRSWGPAASITGPLPSQSLAWTRLCQPQWWLVHVGLHLFSLRNFFPVFFIILSLS